MYVLPDLKKWIHYRVHNGQNIHCQDDLWCGQLTRKYQFPLLYLWDRRPQVMVVNHVHLLGGKVTWDFNFRRDLTNAKVMELTYLLTMLDKIFLS